jgi:predicted nucleic acid-binding protein
VTLVDTNVLVDILSNDPNWREWSEAHLVERSVEGPLVINEIVYAELAARFARQDQLDNEISDLDLTFMRMPKSALFSAGRAFERYRHSGGTRTGVLPDLFIGAHAEVNQWPLLTRDTRRYLTYFPKVELITPLV